MKTIILLLGLVISFTSFALTEQQTDDALELILKIKRITKNRWNIEPSWGDGLSIESKSSFIGSELGNTNAEGPQAIYFRVNISFKVKVFPQMYPMMLSSYKRELSTLSAKSKRTIKHETKEGYDYYSPETNAQWKLFFKFKSAENAFESLPKYYYRSLGLNVYIPDYLVVPESIKVYTQLKQDISQVLALLTKYNLPPNDTKQFINAK